MTRIHDLNDLAYFAAVAEHGGFAAAERATDTPKSKLSRRVAQLEARLGTRLIQRTTRRFALTEAGRAKQREVGGRHSVEVAQAVTSRLSQAEMDELERLCGKLAARGPGQPASGSPSDEAGRPTRRPAARPRNVKTTKDAS